MQDKRAKMQALKLEGKTYDEIAKIYHISKQRVYQLIGKADIRYHRPISKKLVKYKGLRDWMNTNKISFAELVRKLWGNYHPALYARLLQRFTQDALRLPMIKQLIEITGLTFEQLFLEEETNGNSNN